MSPSSNGPTIGVGCGALLAITVACLASGGVPYFSSEADRWRAIRDTDVSDRVDPLILMIDEHAIEEAETNMGLSAGCAGCSGLIGLLGVGGAIALYFRSRRTGTSSSAG